MVVFIWLWEAAAMALKGDSVPLVIWRTLAEDTEVVEVNSLDNL
jgi:hypothetical protein